MDRPPDPFVGGIIHMAGLCSKFHCLPDQGGLMDQDPLKVWFLTIYLEAQQERERRDQDRQKREQQREKAKRG